MPDWPVPYVDKQDSTTEDMAAAAEINDRYHSTLQAHFGVELG